MNLIDFITRLLGYVKTGVALALYYPAAMIIVASVAIQHDNAEASRVADDLFNY